MLDKIKVLLDEVSSYSIKNSEDLEQFRIQYLGKKGIINNLFIAFKEVPNNKKTVNDMKFEEMYPFIM